MKFSIVIVAKNAAGKIERLLQSITGLSDDVIVCDSGSSDNTIELAKSYGVSVYEIEWKGYGLSKNEANGFARYDWILSLDSDEKVDRQLYEALIDWEPRGNNVIYQVKWKNFFGDEWIRHSDWGNDWKNRLFHKHTVQWDDAIAHEDLWSQQQVTKSRLPGYVEHYSFANVEEYAKKMVQSAMLMGMKYHRQNKSCSWSKIVVAPWFTFFKTYFLKAGFLDGKKGWMIAVTSANYTFLKYARLYELNQQRTDSAAETKA
jgi:glycosyltransferase involved in cell wall biosynthesis